MMKILNNIQRNIFIPVIAGVVLINIINTMAQNVSPYCATPTSPNHITQQMLENAAVQRNTSYIVKIMVHSINENNGTGGPTYQEVVDELKRLENYYSPHGICFAFMGYDKINNSTYASDPNFTTADANALVAAYPPNSNVLDMYILPSYTFFRGTAFAIPNHYLCIYAERFNTAHLAHETGHCLGLYHTHETAFGVEYPDGSNCGSAGDLCCDTPADDDGGWSSNPCAYTGGGYNCGQAINASPYNIISYAPFACRNSFTTCQQNRMITNLIFSSILQPLKVTDANLSLASTYSSGYSFYAATNSITGLSTFGVTNSAFVTLNAGNYVLLSDGVSITPNSSGHFMATVNQCNFNLLKLVDYNYSFNQPQPSFTDEQTNSLTISPNPFEMGTTLKIILAEQKRVHLMIYNEFGKQIEYIYQGELLDAGIHDYIIDGSSLPVGLYLVVMKYDDATIIKKIVRIK